MQKYQKGRLTSPQRGHRRNRREVSTQTDTDDQPQPLSAQTPKGRSGKKFSLFEGKQNVSDDEYFIISGLALIAVAKEFTCKACKQKSLDCRIVNQRGFAFTVKIVCEACEELQVQLDSCPRITCKDSTRPPFESNRKLVEAFIRCGRGYNAMLKFGTIVGMKVMDQSSYRDHLLKLVSENGALKKEILSPRQAVRRFYEEENPNLVNEEIIEVVVSFDGSWHKRGRTSNHGFVAVIEVNTGLVIDYEILSKYCHLCCITAAEMDKDSPEFIEWYERHYECNTNFSGASGNMEREGAVMMWKRSEHDAKMRYTRFISDGDAKTPSAIQEAQPYGPDVLIEKDECTNHVGKRLGTALRNTVDLSKMKNAVLAPIHHCASTDAKPTHQYCPPGPESWCFYQMAKAANNRSKPSHKDMKTVINKQVFDAILPVYKRLSDSERLKRCQSNLTQNANEALHNVIWCKVPKTTFIGKGRLELGVTKAVGEFNMGCVAFMATQAEVTERPNSAQSM
ncbi:Citrate synthase-lysine N-methyltransferase CSKMT, mitochondrial, partial [Frankliniella fusca]